MTTLVVEVEGSSEFCENMEIYSNIHGMGGTKESMTALSTVASRKFQTPGERRSVGKLVI